MKQIINNIAKNQANSQSAKSIVADHQDCVTQFNCETARQELWQISELLQNPHLTPVKGDKNPYQKDWQTKKTPIWSIDYEIDIGRASGFGLVTGNGYFAFDIDGRSAHPLLEQLFEGCNAPDTLSWTSGKDGKYQLLYKIPESYLDHFLGKTRTVIWSESGEGLELRYERCQSVLPPSKHPETGRYYWINSPYDTDVAYLPESVCEKVLEYFKQEQKSHKSKNYSKSKGTKSDGYVGNSCFNNIIDKIDNALSLDEKYDWYGHHFARKNENEIWGYCPNHTSQSGTAFQVNLNDHTWYCFGCEKGGKFPQYKAFLETGDTKASGKYFIQILEEYGDRAGYDALELFDKERKQFTKFTPDIKIQQDFLSDSPILDENSAYKIDGNKAIKASKGRGKTTAIRKERKKGKKITLVSCRDALTRNFAESSGLPHINDVKQSPQGIVSNLDSVNRITPLNEESDILVFDEIESIFKHLIIGSTTIKSRRKQVLNKLQNMVQKANEVWLLDAFLTDSTVAYLEEIFGIKFTKIENTKKKKLKSVTKISAEDTFQKANKNAKNNQRVFFITDNKNNDANRAYEILKEKGNTILINAKTKHEYPDFLANPTQYIYENNIDHVVATTCLGIGFSVENYDYFDAVIASFSSGYGDSKDNAQFLFRLRDFDVPRFVSISNRKIPYDKQFKEQIHYLLDNNQYISDEEKQNAKTYIELELESNLQKGLDLLLTRDEIETKNYLKCCWDLIREYSENYYNFEGYPKDEKEELPSAGEVKQQFKQENAQKILNADDSKWSKNSDSTFYSVDPSEKDETWKKQHYKRYLEGIEESEFWNEEKIIELEDGYYKKVKNYYNLIDFHDDFLQKQRKKLLNHFAQDKFYADVKTINDLYIKILHDIDFIELINRGYYFAKNDDLIEQIKQRLDDHPWGHKIPQAKNFNTTINNIINDLGLTVRRSKRCGHRCYNIEHSPFFIFVYTRLLTNKTDTEEADQISQNSTHIKNHGSTGLKDDLNKVIEQKQKSQENNDNEQQSSPETNETKSQSKSDNKSRKAEIIKDSGALEEMLQRYELTNYLILTNHMGFPKDEAERILSFIMNAPKGESSLELDHYGVMPIVNPETGIITQVTKFKKEFEIREDGEIIKLRSAPEIIEILEPL